jgi:hypothetical protein
MLVTRFTRSMKQLTIVLLLATFACGSGASDDMLAASELAHHLGIKFWVSKVRLQGADYDLEVIHVQNGKEVRSVLSGSVFATDREFTRIAIHASQTPHGMRFSMQTETGPKVASEGKAPIPLGAILPLPAAFAQGDYILRGDIPPRTARRDQPICGSMKSKMGCCYASPNGADCARQRTSCSAWGNVKTRRGKGEPRPLNELPRVQQAEWVERGF